jgi:hypothetical protein
MKKSENINELATALSKCQGEMQPAIKDSINPHFRSKFSTLYSVWESCRKPLSKNGLSVVQTMEMINDKLYLTTTLLHLSGQWISSETPVISARQDAQGIGSSLSYFKRYSLSALLGICSADEDDDGEQAMPKNRDQKSKDESSPPKEEYATPTIGKEKVELLQEQTEICDPEYAKKLINYLKTQDVNSLSQVREDMYNKILNGLMKNVEIYQKSLNEG